MPGIRLAGRQKPSLWRCRIFRRTGAGLEGQRLSSRALLSGQQRELEMELELEEQTVRFQVRSLCLLRERRPGKGFK